MRKKSFHIWRLVFICLILATIGFFCVQGNILIDFCSKIFVRANVLPSYNYTEVLGEAQQVTILGVTATDKQFDDELSVETVVTAEGIAQGDDAKVVCVGQVSTPDVGNQKYVALSNFEIVGADKDKYSLPATIDINYTFVNILPKEVELVWVTKDNQTQYTYDTTNQIATVSAYYKDIQNKRVVVDVSVKGYSLSGTTQFASEFKNAGNYTAKAICLDNNYLVKDNDGDQELNLKMDRAKSSITLLNNKSFVYNGLMQDASRCAVINNSEQTLVFKNNTFTTVAEAVEINKKGGVSVSAPQTENYLEIAEIFYKIVVEKATAEIDISKVETNYIYNGDLQTVDGAVINNEEQTLKYSNNTFTTVKEANLINKNGGVCIYADDTENYKPVSVYLNLNVSKKVLDIYKIPFKWGVTSFGYDGSKKTVSIIDPPSTLVINFENNEKTDAGSYMAKATFSLRDTENYELPYTTLYKEWSISKVKVTKPQTQNYETTYTGQTQTLNVLGGTYYSVTNNNQTDAGLYSLSYSLNDQINYVWDDNTSEDLTFSWTIKKAKVLTPIFKSTIIYDGKAHNVIVEDSRIYTILQNPQSEIGDYKTYLVLKDTKNYEWMDNTTSSYIALSWSIVENENYNSTTPTIAIAFMVSAVILCLLYVTLHFTSVRRKKRKKVTVKTSAKEDVPVLSKQAEIKQNKPSQEVESDFEIKAQNDVKTSEVSEQKALVEKEASIQENNKEDKKSDLKIDKEEALKTSIAEDDKQEKSLQKQNNVDVEKSRKKRMLSRKKADKKRKKKVVDEAPKKRGRPKKVEGQKPTRKKVVKKSTKQVSKK